MAYVTLAELKAWLDITSTTNDSVLLSCSDAAQQYIDTMTGRTFEAAPAATVRTFDAQRDVSSDGLTLYLNVDCAAITGCTNGDSTALAPTDFVTNPRYSPPYYSVVIKRSVGKAWTYTTDAEGAISITGQWCYSTSAPADIQHATKILASQLYQQRANASDADRMISVDGVVIVPSSIPKVAADIIGKYRRLSF